METSLLLFTNAFLLGLRHGLDWDHLAAISDIVGTTSASGTASMGKECARLSTSYAVGHATVVTFLGAAVIAAGNFMPPWIGSVAERLVGLTLIMLGGWLVCTLFQTAKQSHSHSQPRRYGVATTFGVGMIHGIGAETGSQMLLLASVGGAGNNMLAMCLLLSFVIGLLISNSAIAMAGIAGFTAARFKQLNLTLGAAAACFSIWVGVNLLR